VDELARRLAARPEDYCSSFTLIWQRVAREAAARAAAAPPAPAASAEHQQRCLEASFLPSLLGEFLEVLESPAPTQDAACARYCQLLVALVVDLLAQLPTRRFLKLLLVDCHFALRCWRSALAGGGRGTGAGAAPSGSSTAGSSSGVLSVAPSTFVSGGSSSSSSGSRSGTTSGPSNSSSSSSSSSSTGTSGGGSSSSRSSGAGLGAGGGAAFPASESLDDVYQGPIDTALLSARVATHEAHAEQ
jgi:hypothetical protein